MKTLALLLILSAVCIFAQTIDPIEPPTNPLICTPEEKEPGPCTKIYQPVCGFYNNQKGNQVQKTFGNRCMACKSENVKYVYEGECEKFPKNTRFCTPYPPNLSIMCATIYKPVCAYLNKNAECKNPPCTVTAPNDCYGCYYTSNVDYYVPGNCKKSPKN